MLCNGFCKNGLLFLRFTLHKQDCLLLMESIFLRRTTMSNMKNLPQDAAENAALILPQRQPRAVNSKHKDSLFRIIFRDKKELLSLCNALADTDFQNPEDLTITTLEDVLYINLKNDISFLLGDHMNLYEHQSTFNPNMPLRGLLYMAELYKPFAASQKLYSSRLLELPTPHYVVFYNGTREMPDALDLKLSDAFIHKDISPAVEVTAHMLNINHGHNKKLMEKCRKLQEYDVFIAAIRKFQQADTDLEIALSLAMDECIRSGILTEILERERMVIMSCILSEFDEEAYTKVIREDGFEEGFETGFDNGFSNGFNNGFDSGFNNAQQKLLELTSKLLAQKRYADLERSTKDKDFLESLYQEFNL